MTTEQPDRYSSEDDPDWADLPEAATGPTRRFFEQLQRDILFVSSDVRFARDFRRIVEKVAKAVLPDKEPRSGFPTLFDRVDTLEREAEFNNHVRYEVVATRFADNYLVFVSDAIGEIFKAHPSTLRSAETVRIEDVLQHESMEAFASWLAEERVNRLSFKGLSEIERFVQKRFSFDLAVDLQNRRELAQAIAERNILVHRRGIVDTQFLAMLTEAGVDVSGYQVGTRIPRVSNYSSLPAVTASVRHVEEVLRKKYHLPVEQFMPALPFSVEPGAAAVDPPLDGRS